MKFDYTKKIGDYVYEDMIHNTIENCRGEYCLHNNHGFQAWYNSTAPSEYTGLYLLGVFNNDEEVGYHFSNYGFLETLTGPGSIVEFFIK